MKKSLIWEFFTKISDEKVKCNLCRQELPKDKRSNTSGYSRHLLKTKDKAHQNAGLKYIEYVSSSKGLTPKKSYVWEYFTELPDLTVQCNLCRKLYNKGGVKVVTSNLIEHLTHSHKILRKFPVCDENFQGDQNKESTPQGKK